jgi:hypothetical protein
LHDSYSTFSFCNVSSFIDGVFTGRYINQYTDDEFPYPERKFYPNTGFRYDKGYNANPYSDKFPGSEFREGSIHRCLCHGRDTTAARALAGMAGHPDRFATHD